MSSGLEMFVLISSVIFGTAFLAYGILFRRKHPEFKFLPVSYIYLGCIFLSFPIPILTVIPSILSPLLFFGGMGGLLLVALIYRKDLEKEQRDYLVKRLKGIEGDKKIGLSDIFSRDLILKILLKRGPGFTSKITSLVFGAGLSTGLTIGYYFTGSDPAFLIGQFIFIWLLSPIFFYIIRKRYRKTYDEYRRLKE